jgi:hypothetical protein
MQGLKRKNIIKKVLKKLRGENPNDEKIYARRTCTRYTKSSK